MFQYENPSSTDLFYDNNELFYKNFNDETSNVKNKKEKLLIDKTKSDYLKFVKLFSKLHTQNITIDSASITSFSYNIKHDLADILEFKRKAMFDAKNKFNAVTTLFIYATIFSIFIVIIGLIISIYHINRALKPVRALIQTIKSIKAGDLSRQAPVIYNDEIGTLAIEFNDMTRKLYEYEKSSEGSLMMEKNRSLTIVKSISDPIIVLDVNYRITLLNKACENFFNIKEEEVINKHVLDTIRNLELYDHIFSAMNNIESTEKTIKVTSDNKIYFFNTTVTTINYSKSGIDGVVVLMKNVTELKQLEKIRTDFIDTVSHEFKTPLTSIIIGRELLEDTKIGFLNEKQIQILDSIKDDTNKLTDLVTNLLRLSRIQSDRTIFNIKPCNIVIIIKNCYKTYETQAKSMGIKLFSELEDLPFVLADKEKIEWLLNNLISNSLKHTNSGDEIYIGAYEKNNMIYIFVRDTGEGMEDEYREKIFEKFVQIKSNDYWSGSIGLGLSIAKEIVDAHKGTIWCESELNIGSTFTFTLPTTMDKEDAV